MKQIILMPNGYADRKGARPISLKELHNIVTKSEELDQFYNLFSRDLEITTNELKRWMLEQNFNKLNMTEEQSAKYTEFKKRLPSYIAGASEITDDNTPSIQEKHIKELSDLFMVDIDLDKDFNPQDQEFKNKLKQLPECRFFANSPTGVRMIIEYYVQDEKLRSNYSELFKHILDNLQQRYGILGFEIDPNCKNVDRKGIIISDPNAFYKEDGTPFIIHKSEFVDIKKEIHSEDYQVVNSKPAAEVLEIFCNKIKTINDGKAEKIWNLSKWLGGLYAGEAFTDVTEEEIKDKLYQAIELNANRNEEKHIVDVKHAQHIVKTAFKAGLAMPIKPKKVTGLKTFKLRDYLNMTFPSNEPIFCGYPMWDKMHLIKRGCITTILGATSSRKSTFLINIAARLAQHKQNVLYVIIEGNIKRNVNAVMAQLNNIAMKDVKIEHFNNEILDFITIAHHNYALVTVNDLKAKCKEEKFDAIVLDYVTLLSEDEENMFLKGQMISQKLKNLAEEYNLGIITANQTNKMAVNKIQIDAEDVGESHGITMAFDVMLGIIKYKRLESLHRTALEIIKIRDIPDEVVEEESNDKDKFKPIEGRREYYSINFTNKMITPVDDKKLNKLVEADIKNSTNDKRKTGDDEEPEKIIATSISVSPVSDVERMRELFKDEEDTN